MQCGQKDELATNQYIMELIKCPKCGNVVPPGSATCLVCGNSDFSIIPPGSSNSKDTGVEVDTQAPVEPPVAAVTEGGQEMPKVVRRTRAGRKLRLAHKYLDEEDLEPIEGSQTVPPSQPVEPSLPSQDNQIAEEPITPVIPFMPTSGEAPKESKMQKIMDESEDDTDFGSSLLPEEKDDPGLSAESA